jgi:hypothetical protein
VVLSRGDFEATRLAAPKSRVPGHVPHLVAHLVAHHVVPGPIRVDSCHSWAILLSSVCSVCSVDCLLLSAFRSLLVAFEVMFQTSEASRRSRGTHGGACHVVVLEQSDKRRRTRSSAGRITERNIPKGKRGLAAPGTPARGDRGLSPRHFVAIEAPSLRSGSLVPRSFVPLG